MHPPLAALGLFIFAPSFGSYEQMSREVTSPRATLATMGGPDLKQWMGMQHDLRTISGSVWPEIQLPGMLKLEFLGEWARTGRPLPLLMGFGGVKGLFGIEGVSTTDGELQRWGFPGEITFEIQLVRL